MTSATVSENYQIEIPEELREVLNIKPGQKVAFIRYKGTAHLVPVRSIEEAAGFLPGLDTEIHHELDREL